MKLHRTSGADSAGKISAWQLPLPTFFTRPSKTSFVNYSNSTLLNMDELFDVFNEKTSPSKPSQTSAEKANASKKRQSNGQVKGADGTTSLPATDGLEAEAKRKADAAVEAARDQPEHKRRKRDEPEPVVADTFETEKARQVESFAGLQAAEPEASSVTLSHQVRHQVALPPDYDYVPISQHKAPEQPAKTYPFTLDPFQQVSVASIERNESVLVSAHTSAGKTVVAEYAIAQCLKNNQKVIYTSPIKALSNQKYREFNQEFGDVGLMTGDITINPEASCLVMTTEILRSMLYRGSEIMREVAWVIFDEVHYMRDKERGVVWEETIILLPDRVRYVFLSATIPNAMQFAEWITKTHNQPCHVVYTDFRPTPLQHYLFPKGSDGIHLVVDEKGDFKDENFEKAMSKIADEQDDGWGGKKKKGKGQTLAKGSNRRIASDIYKIVKMIMLKSFNPVIVFSFSKRDCEDYALQMAGLAFNDENEKAMVNKVFDSAMAGLSLTDRRLPQIDNILPLLRKGIGVHHSGLLPILKETIEILFQEGLIKVLFATETFSIGLNMPAKTVVFTSVKKFDGKSERFLSPSEFIQMSGRAGRRGIDPRGIVIMMVDQKVDPVVAKNIVRGEQDKLNSEFRLGYNMILNLMRVEGISPEYMLERCFFQFQNTASVSGLEKQLSELEIEKDSLQIEDEATVRNYYELRKNVDNYSKEMKEVIQLPNYCLQFMQPGRLVKIKHGKDDFGWGAVVSFNERKPTKNQAKWDAKPQNRYVVDVLLPIANPDSVSSKTKDAVAAGIRPPAPGEKGQMVVVPVLLSCIDAIGHVRIFLPQNLRSADERNGVRKSLDEVKKRFPDGIALLDPIENMGITDDNFKRLLRKIEVLESRLLSNPLHNSPRLPELYSQYQYKVELTDRIKGVKHDIMKALSIMQLDELKGRKRVLRRLGFIDDKDVVQLKARVACEISTGDELVLSELMFNNWFNEMSPPEIAAAVSCFIMEEKTNKQGPLTNVLKKYHSDIVEQAKTVARVAEESKIAVDEDAYLGRFKSDLMAVAYAWAEGKSFAEICKLTDVYEGSLIRLFRRLDEVLRQMVMGAKVMGNEELAKKFEVAQGTIVRDLVGAASLYL